MMSPRPDGAYAHEIRVTWGDCDPARIAYTARLPWFALDAINGWWEEKLGGGWYQMELDHGLGTPFVRLEMDFRKPVTPRHRLICHTWPERLGGTSITFRVDGEQDGRLCFSTRTVSVFVDPAEFTKRSPPENVRELVRRHVPENMA